MNRFLSIKGVTVISLIAVAALPLYAFFALYPGITNFVMQQTERNARKVATHLAAEIQPEILQSGKDLPPHFRQQVTQDVGTLGLMKVKIFLPSGETLFSTEQADIGIFNTATSFHEKVLKGETYSQIIKKDSKSLEGQAVALDVVETYVPITKDTTTVGAFEIYYDITDTIHALGVLLTRLSLILFALVFCLVAAVFVGFLRAHQSVTRQLQSEANLRDEVDFIYTILDSVNATVILLDKKFRITFMNKHGEDSSGYLISEVTGRFVWDFFLLPEEADGVKATLQHVLEKGQSVQGENFWVSKNGEQRLMAWSNSLLGAGKPKDSYIISTGIDITDSRQLTDMLVQANEDWEETFNSIDDAITLHDKNMCIIRANTAVQKITGLSESDILTQKCFKLYHGISCPPNDCPSCTTLKTGRETITETYEPHLQKHLRIKAFPRVDANNNPVGVIHVTRDISHRKKAEEDQIRLQAQLIQSQKLEAIGQLAGGVAHDFNNLLTGIIGFVGLAKDQVDENSPIHSDLTETLDLAKRAASLTRQLLAFSRRQILEPEPVNVTDLLQNMSKMLHRLLGEDISLEYKPTSKGGPITADPGQLEQVVVNLAINARQAMPEGGTLTIETADVILDEGETKPNRLYIPPGTYIKITVQDTGVGISQEIQGQIFDPFFTTKEVGIGSGLGLSTVYGIVKQHKGYTWVESEPGKGAAFIVYLPISETLPVEENELRKTPLINGLSSILIVEDDLAVLQVTQRMLKNLEYRVYTASNPDEAEKIFLDYMDDISILLTDVILPARNGKELSQKLLGIKPSLKVLFMSGHTQDIIVQKGILQEDTPFIKKPFTQEDLEQKLHSLP